MSILSYHLSTGRTATVEAADSLVDRQHDGDGVGKVGSDLDEVRSFSQSFCDHAELFKVKAEYGLL